MSPQELYIPPPGISVRIVNLKSRRALLSRSHAKPSFWHHPFGDDYPDQWWQIIPGSGSHEGTYIIKSDQTSQALFSRENNAPNVGTDTEVGKYNDQYFVFEAGTGKRAGYFRIKAPSTGTVMVSRDSPEPQLCNYPAANMAYDDQYFTFLFEDMEVDSIIFNDGLGIISGTTPSSMGKQKVPNGTSIPQTSSVTFSEQEDREYSFEHTTGMSLTVGTELSFGVPGIADGKVSMSASHTEEFKWGSTTKTGKGTSYTFNVTAPPHKTVTAHATMNKSRMNVPYTMTLKSKSAGVKVVSEGVFIGVHMYDASCTYTEAEFEG